MISKEIVYEKGGKCFCKRTNYCKFIKPISNDRAFNSKKRCFIGE